MFGKLIPARTQLQPLLALPPHPDDLEPPLLVVGSGFSAADVIITNLPKRKIIHLFKWDTENKPSPLRACHPQAYPEYAAVYKRMKRTALGQDSVHTPKKQKPNPFSDPKLDVRYEGFPNTLIKSVFTQNGLGRVTLRMANGLLIEREVSNLEYVIGRRGSLSYLDQGLQEEVLGPKASVEYAGFISSQTLRSKVEDNLEVAPDVFAVGSLTGDSLIRHAFGACIYTAREIMARQSYNDTTLKATSICDGAHNNLSSSMKSNGSIHKNRQTTPATDEGTLGSKSSISRTEPDASEKNPWQNNERWESPSSSSDASAKHQLVDTFRFANEHTEREAINKNIGSPSTVESDASRQTALKHSGRWTGCGCIIS